MIHVLYLDDEAHNLTAFRAAFRRVFEVHVTTVPSEAVRMLQEFPIEVVISDQKMPDISGVEFFEMIMADHPEPVRMLLTGHADIDAVIDAINKGRIYKYISKPWNELELQRLVEEASEIYRERQQSDAATEAYGTNLVAIRDSLQQLQQTIEGHSELSESERSAWANTLSRVIQWIEPPDSTY